MQAVGPIISASASVVGQVTVSAAHGVVLLHGLGRSRRSMQPMARALMANGYRVHNIGYESRSAGIASLATRVARIIAGIEPGTSLHFVTHSLGGILLRVAVSQQLLPLHRIVRVVMLGPPNQGSEVADALSRLPVVRTVYRLGTGPAGRELGVFGIAGQLPPLPFDTGIIAGSRSVNPLLSLLLPGPNDGKVTVAHASVSGMRDFVVMPHSHPFLMRMPAVIRQTISFLETGMFAP